MVFSINGSLLTHKLLEGQKDQDDKSVFPRIFRSDRHFAFAEHQISFPKGFLFIAYRKDSLSCDSIEDYLKGTRVRMKRHGLARLETDQNGCAAFADVDLFRQEIFF